MKKAILFIGYLLIASLLCAQQIHFQQEPEKPRRGYIGISVGAGIPVSEFGSTDIKGDYSGYARTGLSLQLVNFGYTFGNAIGIAGMWTGNAFNVDGDAMLQDLDIGNLNLEADPWSFGALMFGILISLPADKFNVDFRAMVGYGYATAPEIHISGFVDGSLYEMTQKSASSNAVAYDFGIGFRIHLSRLICLNLLLDYVGCKPTFTSMIYSGSAGIYQSFEFEQPMGHVTTTAGIGFKLK